MNYIKLFFTVVTSTVLVLSYSCKKEKVDPVIPNEEELITSLYLTLIDSIAGDTIVMSFIDLDGDGGNPPTVSGGTLVSNSVYYGQVLLLNETVNPPDNISNEVEDEGEEHQFFYEALSGLELNVDYSDEDSDGNPIGLTIRAISGTESNGELRITLRHEADKFGDGVSDGNIANAGGETDIQVTFDVEIQ